MKASVVSYHLPQAIKNSPFFVSLPKSKKNSLESNSYANVSQLRAVSKLRFLQKIGEFEKEVQEEIVKKFLEILEIDILQLKYF